MTRTPRSNSDAQKLIRCMLSLPIFRGDVLDVEDATAMEDFESANTDVLTRMILGQINKSLQTGDSKATEMVLKYAGYQPPSEMVVEARLPTFVENVGSELINVTPQPKYLAYDDASPEQETLEPVVFQLKCVETGDIYNSLDEASEALHVSKYTIGHCIREGKKVGSMTLVIHDPNEEVDE